MTIQIQLPSPLHTANKVATEPFPDKSVRTESVGEGAFKAVRVVNTKTDLVRLKVLFDAEVSSAGTNSTLIRAGDAIWVRAADYAQPWGKEVFAIGEDKFVLIPANRIEVMERQ